MAKNKIDVAILAKRIDLLEMQFKQMEVVESQAIDGRLKNIEETLYSSKEMLTAKEVCQYLDISQSLLYKLTSSGRIPHYKPRGKMVYFEKKEIVKWMKKHHVKINDESDEYDEAELNASSDNEEKSKEQY